MTIQNLRPRLILILLLAVATPGCRQSPSETDEPLESSEEPRKPDRKKNRLGRTAGDGLDSPAVSASGESKEQLLPEEPDPPEKPDRPEVPEEPQKGGAANETQAPETPPEPGRTASPEAHSPAEPSSSPAEDAAPGSGPATLPALPAPPVRIPVTDMLSTADLTMTLTDRGWLAYGPVAGIQTSIHYNSVVYRIVGSRRFVALQAWAFDQPVRAIERWNQLYATYPNVQDIKGQFAQMLFYSSRRDVHQMVMVEPNRNMVLSLSCSVSGCSQAELLSLSAIVFQRTQR